MSRRGRRPDVKANGDDYSVVVKGQKFEFRAGGDGRLRALGAPDRGSEDFAFARELVAGAVANREDTFDGAVANRKDTSDGTD